MLAFLEFNALCQLRKSEEHPPWIFPGAGGLLPKIVTLVDYYNIVVEGCFSVLLLKLARVAFIIFWIRK